MDLRLLRPFVVVAEELHFTRAAARLGVAQPALSQQLRRLEEQLGYAVLERSTRRVALTQAGVELLAAAQQALAMVDTAIEAGRQAQQ